jgi:GntR family transcriptional regulator
MLRLEIDSESAVPVYLQVIQRLKIEILSGRLKNGDRLPPIRDLAKILKLNPNTVAKAYSALESEGFLESRPGSGNWVKLRTTGLDALRKSLLDGEVRTFLDKAFSLGAGSADIRDSLERIISHE